MQIFSKKRGGGGLTTYSGAICIANLLKKGGGGPDPLDTPPGSAPGKNGGHGGTLGRMFGISGPYKFWMGKILPLDYRNTLHLELLVIATSCKKKKGE